MMAKAIIPILKDFKEHINNTNDRLIRQYCMMTRVHERYKRLFRQTHKTFEIPFSITYVQGLYYDISGYITKNTQTIC